MSKEFNIRLARDHLNDYLRNESELRPSVIHTALDNAETLLTEGREWKERALRAEGAIKNCDIGACPTLEKLAMEDMGWEDSDTGRQK